MKAEAEGAEDEGGIVDDAIGVIDGIFGQVTDVASEAVANVGGNVEGLLDVATVGLNSDVVVVDEETRANLDTPTLKLALQVISKMRSSYDNVGCYLYTEEEITAVVRATVNKISLSVPFASLMFPNRLYSLGITMRTATTKHGKCLIKYSIKRKLPG